MSKRSVVSCSSFAMTTVSLRTSRAVALAHDGHFGSLSAGARVVYSTFGQLSPHLMFPIVMFGWLIDASTQNERWRRV